MNKLRGCVWHITFLIVATIVCVTDVGAREWMIVGPRALGMGGANVAVANDATASYWNPAAYGFFKWKDGDISEKRDWSTFLGAGVGAQIHEDLGEEISKILEFDYDTLDNGVIPANKVADFLQLVNELKTFDGNENRAITVTASGRFGIQKGHWGLAGYAFGDLSAKGDLDLINIAPVSSGATFTIDEFTAPANYGYAGTPDTYTYYDQSGNPASSDLITYLTTTLGWTQNQAEDFTDITD